MQGKAGGSHSQDLGTAQPHSLFLSWRPTSALIPSATQKRLVYRKLLCYWLDFVSSSLIYSLRQMPAFPCSALRYRSPTQQLTETPTCLSSKPEKSKCGKPVSHSIYQLMHYYPQSSAQTEKEPSATLPGMWHVHAHITSHQHCLRHKPEKGPWKQPPGVLASDNCPCSSESISLQHFLVVTHKSKDMQKGKLNNDASRCQWKTVD